LVTIASLRALRALGVVHFADYSCSLARELALPSLMYSFNVGLSLNALEHLSIAVYQVIKRLTPLATVVLARIVVGKKESVWVHLSVLAIFVGTVVTGLGDLRFHLLSYACGIGSVVSQCLYLLHIQRSGIKHSVLTMMYGNSFNCLGLLLVQEVFSGAIASAAAHPEIATLNLWLHLGLVLTLGVVLNFALFLCTTQASALTTTVVGCLKAIFSTLLGFFTFGGQPVTFLLLLGTFVNTAGALSYMWIRYCEKLARQLPSRKDDPHESDGMAQAELLASNATSDPAPQDNALVEEGRLVKE